MSKYLSIVLGLILVAVGITATVTMSASADTTKAGDSPENPIVVTTPSEVPEGAIEDEVSTYDTVAECDNTRSWVLTIPATDDTTREEARYQNDVAGTDAVTHEEYLYEREVAEYSTKWKIIKVYAEDVFDDVWYSYNPAVDKTDDNPLTGDITKDNGWQVNNGSHTGLYKDPNFAVNQVWHSDGGNGDYWYVDRTVEHEAGDIYPLGPWYVTQNEEPTTHNGQTIGVPFEVGGTLFEYVIAGSEQVQVGSETESSGWVLEAPDGEGWELVDTRTVVDEEAVPGYTEYFVLGGEPSLNIEDASWVTDDQMPGRPWYEFDRRTVMVSEGTPEQVVYYAYSDGQKCEKPEEPEEPNEPVDDPPKKSETTVPTVVDSGL